MTMRLMHPVHQGFFGFMDAWAADVAATNRYRRTRRSEMAKRAARRRTMVSGWTLEVGETGFIALTSTGIGPAIFSTRAKARAYAAELREHLSGPIRVVRAWCDVRTER